MLKNIEYHIKERIMDAINQDVRIIRSGYLIRFNIFKQIMENIQSAYIDFIELEDFTRNNFQDDILFLCEDEYKTYTEKFLNEHHKLLLEKNLFIFDQIALLNVTHTEYTYPSNIHSCLTFVQKYAPSKFDHYANKLLEVICKNAKLNYTENATQECLSLISFINENSPRTGGALGEDKFSTTGSTRKDASTTGSTDKNILLKQIYKILINRQCQVNHEGYENAFYYYVTLKHKINTMVMHRELSIDDGMLCLIMEIIDTHISMMIGVNGIRSVYCKEVDYHKVNLLLDSAIQYKSLTDVNLENGLLKIVANIHKQIY